MTNVRRGSEFHCFGAQWAKQRWPKVSVVGDTKYLGVCRMKLPGSERSYTV